jgi:hypothetical protein
MGVIAAARRMGATLATLDRRLNTVAGKEGIDAVHLGQAEYFYDKACALLKEHMAMQVQRRKSGNSLAVIPVKKAQFLNFTKIVPGFEAPDISS